MGEDMRRLKGRWYRDEGYLRGLTFELTPTAEAGAVSRDGDDSTAGAGPAYSACRSGSGVERVVRHRRGQPNEKDDCLPALVYS